MLNYSINLILWKHNTNRHGLYPIYLRATVNRKATYKSTGHFIKEKDWDADNQKIKSPTSNLINARLSRLKNEWEEKLITTQLRGKELSSNQLKKSFRSDHTNIFEFVDSLIIKLKGKKSEGTLSNYRKHLKKLESYHGSRVLSFDSIDVSFLGNYEAWLRENINHRKDEEQKNYIHAIWKTLKTWFNAAKREGIISNYPFDLYENPVYISPDKDYLNTEELKKLEEFADETTDKVLKETAVYFLFGCYSGLRISDWYQFNPDKHIKGNKLRLRPAKTKNKWVEMVISKPLQRNLERMKEVQLTLKEPTINEKIKIIASRIKIYKHLSSHSGRHSFAVTICLGNKISSETTAELMGITLATFVKNYSQVTQTKIDSETIQAWKGLK